MPATLGLSRSVLLIAIASLLTFSGSANVLTPTDPSGSLTIAQGHDDNQKHSLHSHPPSHPIRKTRQPCHQFPTADAGADVITIIGRPVRFWGTGASPDDEIAEYTWDFDSDSVPDFVSTRNGFATHTFHSPGEHRCVLTVKDSRGLLKRDDRIVRVVNDRVDSLRVAEELARRRTSRLLLRSRKPPDCFVQRFAVIINATAEERFWMDVTQVYSMLINVYDLDPSDVYVLNHLGTDPTGGNPGGMIDDSAGYPAIQRTFEEIAVRADEDDEVYIWITGHGTGYEGSADRGEQYLGYLTGRASVDPGDEPDYPESDFKLRALFTGGDFAAGHGLNTWQPYARYYVDPPPLYRTKYVSYLDGIYVETVGLDVYDDDVLIERLVDYPIGDTNHDGKIDTTAGETFDFDGDGLWSVDPVTGEFDEEEWGEVDIVDDDFNTINSRLTVGAYPILLFDPDHSGRLCIDLDYAGAPPEVDGCDEDGQGLFDWIDANQDGDTDDTISIDEGISMAYGDFYDDELADLIDPIQAERVVVIALPCYSGGLVDDLSADGRIICTATIEEAVSWGNHFLRAMAGALRGNTDPSYLIDADGNGYVSICEAFNYTAWSDPYYETPQYDDDGDGVSHAYPLPAGGDGELGFHTYLCDTCPPGTCPHDPCSRTVILAQNRPNPFVEQTEVYYWLPATSHVNLDIFDIQGRKVAALVSETQTAGPHWLTWTGRNSDNRLLPSGVYFCRLEVGDNHLIRKMLAVR
jgi:PKD repeat protein